jgi:hypothetical protein
MELAHQIRIKKEACGLMSVPVTEPQKLYSFASQYVSGEIMFGFIKTIIKIKLVIVILIAILWFAKKMHDKHHETHLMRIH